MKSHNTIINSFHNFKSFANQPLFDFIKDIDVDITLYYYLFFKNLEEYINLKKESFMKENPSKNLDSEDFSLLKDTNVKLDLNEFAFLFFNKISEEYKEGKSTVTLTNKKEK
jgi:hypothetical protein